MALLSGRRLEKCPKRDDIINYWPELIEGMRFSTKDFYDRMEAALQARSIPELEVSRVDIKEGGPMTPRRQYLRLRRERLIFDVCAMPFGSGFYVSEWFWEQPRRVGLVLLMILIAIGAIAVAIGTGPYNDVYRFFERRMGMEEISVTHMLVMVPLLAAIIGIIVGVLWFGEAVDGMLLRIPLIGYIYERWLRRLTYYRHDRTQAFQAAAHNALCSVIDDICKVQGIAPLSDAAKRPMHAQIKPNVGPLRRKPGTDGAGPDAGPMQQMQPVG
jgi:hypothetical protein